MCIEVLDQKIYVFLEYGSSNHHPLTKLLAEAHSGKLPYADLTNNNRERERIKLDVIE